MIVAINKDPEAPIFRDCGLRSGRRPVPARAGAYRRAGVGDATDVRLPSRDTTTMNDNATPTILIVPGLRDHVPAHWQTLLEQKLSNAISVPRMEHDKLSCAAWVAKLDESLAAIEGPVILVAHSAGVMIVVHWAQRHRRPIAAHCSQHRPTSNRHYPRGIRRRMSCRRTDGCRRRASDCRFRPSSARVPTIRWVVTNASRRSRKRGVASSSTWATSGISTRRLGTANGRKRKCSSASSRTRARPRYEPSLFRDPCRWRLARQRPSALARPPAQRRHRDRIGVHRRSPGRADAALCASARHCAQPRRRRRQGQARRRLCRAPHPALRRGAAGRPHHHRSDRRPRLVQRRADRRRCRRHDRHRAGAGPDAGTLAPNRHPDRRRHGHLRCVGSDRHRRRPASGRGVGARARSSRSPASPRCPRSR